MEIQPLAPIQSQKLRTLFQGRSVLGVAISGSEQQRHVGLVYKVEDVQETYYLHLAWHHRLQRESINGELYIVECSGLDDFEARQLAVWAETIWDVNGGNVPYGVNFTPYAFFDSAGNIKDSALGVGLTCATFVAHIFSDYNLPIIEAQSWQSRVDDADWQRNIIDILRRYCPDSADAQISCIGVAPRFRPEEVAASAALYEETPINFNTAEQAGLELLGCMRNAGLLRAN